MLKKTIILLFCIVTIVLYALNVRHHYFFTDDCFISFRYALNFFNGYGLVWNPGERVEGYTNFLWVLLMTFGMLIKITPEILSNVLGILSGLVVLVALVYLSAKQVGWSNPIIYFTPLVLASNRSFTGWCTGGLATMFFTMLLFLAVLQFLREREQETRVPIASSLLFALSSLTRPDALLFTSIVGLFFIIEVILRRRKFIHLLTWVTPYIVIVGTHFVWRYYYYGYWLPNTFYVKVSGFWYEQGYKYLSLFHQDFNILFFLPLILIPVISQRRFVYALFLSMIMAYLAYIFYIGGDRFEFRFLIFIFPYFYWLLVEGIRLLATLQFRSKWQQHTNTLIVFVIGTALLVTTYAGSIKERPKLRHGIESLAAIKEYGNKRIHAGKFLRSLVDKGLLPNDIILGVSGAGAVPYYTEWPSVDRLGLNDIKIAHKRFRMSNPVGHQKVGTLRYLRTRKVEMLVNNFILVKRKFKHQQKCGNNNKVCEKTIWVPPYYLHFKTFLTDDEFAKRFEKLL